MANGQQNLMGYGKAQVLPRGNSNLDFVQGLNQQVGNERRYQDQQSRLAQEKKDRDEKELYGVIGNALNPKNFNALIHDKLRLATAELAGKIKKGGFGYGDVYMDAINKAGELGTVSDKLNRVDQILAATRGEYEKYDKRLNTPAIEFRARKKIIDQLKTGQPIDENYNYFDDALGSMGSEALTDKTDALMVDLTPEEAAQSKLTGKYREKKLNREKRFDWNASAFPGFYNVTQQDELQEPTLTAKGVPTGIKTPGMENMASDEAYRRFVLQPSNLVALNERIRKYGVDPSDPKADVLRKVELYNYLEQTKPRVNKQEENRTNYPPSYTINVGGNGGSGAYSAKGNLIDKIDLAYYGSPQQGRIDAADVKIIPADLQAVLKASGIDISAAETVQIEIENGKIMAITPEGGKRIDRVAIENAQKKFNTEGQKQAQPDFETVVPKVKQPTGGTPKVKKGELD